MSGERPTIAGRAGFSSSRSVGFAVMVFALNGCTESARAPASRTMRPASGSADVAAEAVALPTAGGATRGTEAPVPPALPRKIIYNAQVDLVVESMTTTAEALARLVKASGGYISETDSQSYAQQQRQATWKVRVPVDRFDAFLAEVARLGELQKNHLDSQDVTQEYYDIEARIANKQEEEKRLLKHLADSTGKLEDILAVERELSRVRGEIEQMQGRIRYLANVTALSTVTITAIELKDYTPPVSPTFRTQVARTFFFSVDRLADFGKAVVLLLVAALPWLPVATVLALPFWWILRRRRRPARPPLARP